MHMAKSPGQSSVADSWLWFPTRSGRTWVQGEGCLLNHNYSSLWQQGTRSRLLSHAAAEGHETCQSRELGGVSETRLKGWAVAELNRWWESGEGLWVKMRLHQEISMWEGDWLAIEILGFVSFLKEMVQYRTLWGLISKDGVEADSWELKNLELVLMKKNSSFSLSLPPFSFQRACSQSFKSLTLHLRMWDDCDFFVLKVTDAFLHYYCAYSGLHGLNCHRQHSDNSVFPWPYGDQNWSTTQKYTLHNLVSLRTFMRLGICFFKNN